MSWSTILRVLLWPRMDGIEYSRVIGTVSGPLPHYFQCTRVDFGASRVVEEDGRKSLVTRFWYEVETSKDYYSWYEDHEYPILYGDRHHAEEYHNSRLWPLLLEQARRADDMYNFGRIRVKGYNNKGAEWMALTKYPNGCWFELSERSFYGQFYGKNGALKDSIQKSDNKGTHLWREPTFGGGPFCSHRTGWRPGYLY